MKPVPDTAASRPHSVCQLTSVLLLTAGMLLAATTPLRASWLWVLAPMALLLLMEATSCIGGWQRFEGWAFYAALLGVALAFHFAGLPATSAGGCGSGGCGTAGGCGTSGCAASTGGGCSCGSGKTAKSTTTSKTGNATPPSPPAGRPVTATQPNRNLSVQLPPLPPRTPGSSVPAQPGAKPATAPKAPPASGAAPVTPSVPGSVQPSTPPPR